MASLEKLLIELGIDELAYKDGLQESRERLDKWGERLLDTGAKQYLITRRQALLIELGSIEETLGMPRSVTPKRKRDNYAEICYNNRNEKK